jgi:hypothetical protein
MYTFCSYSKGIFFINENQLVNTICSNYVHILFGEFTIASNLIESARFKS